MNQKWKKALTFSLLAVLALPSIGGAGNVKKAYINVAKEGGKAQTSDIPQGYGLVEVESKKYVAGTYHNGTVVGTNFKVAGPPGFGNAMNMKRGNWLRYPDDTDAMRHIAKDNAQFTMEAWVKLDHTNSVTGATWEGDHFPAFSRWNYNVGNKYSFWFGAMEWQGRGVHFAMYGKNGSGTGTYQRWEGGFIPDNQWHHIAAVVRLGTDVKLYMDGKPIAISASAGMPLPKLHTADGTKTMDQTIGQGVVATDYWDNASHRSGFVDEIRVWNRALSDQDILKNYNRPLTGLEPGLLEHYNFN